MAHRPIALLLEDDDAGEPGYLQPLAGGELWTRHPLFAGATAAPPPYPSLRFGAPATASEGAWSVIYDGPGLVDGTLSTIRSALSTAGERRVDFADRESFHLDARGEVLRRRGPGPADARSQERALGAPLALALAMRGVHLLHASAVGVRAGDFGHRGVVALTAQSGAGKSTLAAAAERHPALGWRRVADDILPVRLDPPARALPHFPQLKLAEHEAYNSTERSELKLDHLVEIEHAPQVTAIELERLPPAEACLALARATVAAKLFDPALLRQHFELCAAAGQTLPVHRLRYPTGLDRLPEVLAALEKLGS
jgi:hypothetical protein